VEPLILADRRRRELEDSLLLCFTGVSRFSVEVAKDKIANLEAKATQLRTMRQMVDEAEAILRSPTRPLAEIGRLLHQSWMLKRELAGSITTSVIDEIYEAAMAAGALGGKVLGAGGGGFMAFFVPPEKRRAVAERLKHLIVVPIKVASPGSRVIVYEPGGSVEE
jgi:D-glycero-alpha-D-manno-heptose-7-phosphate kinase